MLRFYLTVLLAALLTAPLLVPLKQAAAAGSGEPSTTQNLFEIQEYIDRLDTEIKSSVPQVHFREMVNKLVQGELDWKPAQIFNQLARQLFKELWRTLICWENWLFWQLLRRSAKFNDLFRKEQCRTAYLFRNLPCLNHPCHRLFSIAVNAGREVVDTMVTFMQAHAGFADAPGGGGRSGLGSHIQPCDSGNPEHLRHLNQDVVLPCFFVAILGIVGNLSERFKVSNLADLLKTVAMGLMGCFQPYSWAYWQFKEWQEQLVTPLLSERPSSVWMPLYLSSAACSPMPGGCNQFFPAPEKRRGNRRSSRYRDSYGHTPLKNHYPGLYLQTGRSTDSTHWQRADGGLLEQPGQQPALNLCHGGYGGSPVLFHHYHSCRSGKYFCDAEVTAESPCFFKLRAAFTQLKGV